MALPQDGDPIDGGRTLTTKSNQSGVRAALYPDFAEYSQKFEHVKMRREGGVLEVVLHTDGESLVWGLDPHYELPAAFRDISTDEENRVVILTGTGDNFSGPPPVPGWRPAETPYEWHILAWEGRRLLQTLLDVPVPVIAAVNGPAYRHSELALMSDIVLASRTAIFGDAGHFGSGLVPGDGLNVVYTVLAGLNRARYLMLTGEPVSAEKAEEWGLVNELLDQDNVLPHAWEIAHSLSLRPLMTLRNTRALFTADLQRRLHDTHAYGLALEALANLDRSDN